MNDTLISVLIPTYNSGKTIKRCLDSVFNQSYRNYEVIVCDAFSNDNTIEIIKHNYHNNVQVITCKKNVSLQRNRLLEKANGAFVFFLDSDDYIDKDCLKNLIKCQKRENADVTVPSFIIFDGNHNSKIVNNDTYYEYSINNFIDNMFGYSVCKLYKKSFIGNTSFDPHYVYGEDYIFNFELAKKEGYVQLSKDSIYYYISDLSYYKKYGLNNAIKLLKYRYGQLKYVKNNKLIDVEKYNSFLCNYCLNITYNCIESKRFFLPLTFIKIRLYYFSYKKSIYILFPLIMSFFSFIKKKIFIMKR